MPNPWEEFQDETEAQAPWEEFTSPEPVTVQAPEKLTPEEMESLRTGTVKGTLDVAESFSDGILMAPYKYAYEKITKDPLDEEIEAAQRKYVDNYLYDTLGARITDREKSDEELNMSGWAAKQPEGAARLAFLQNQFPEYDFESVEIEGITPKNQPAIMYKTPDMEPGTFAYWNKPGFSGEEDLQAFAGEMLNIENVVSTYAPFKVLQAAKKTGTLIRGFLAGTTAATSGYTGSLADTKIADVFNPDYSIPESEYNKRAKTAAVYSVGGEAFGKLVKEASKLTRRATPSELASMSPDDANLVEAAQAVKSLGDGVLEKMNLERAELGKEALPELPEKYQTQLMAGQFADSELARLVEQQLAAMSPAIRKNYEAQRQLVATTIDNLAGKAQNLEALDIDSLIKTRKNMESDLAAMRDDAGIKVYDTEALGTKYQDSLKKYGELAESENSQLYSKLLEEAQGPVSFNIKNVKQRAEEILEATRLKASPSTGVPGKPTPDLVFNEADKKLQQTLVKITQLPDVIQGGNKSAYDSLQAMRKETFSSMVDGNIFTKTPSQNSASSIYAELTTSMKNPIGEGVREGWKDQWQAASDQVRKFKGFMDESQVKTILESGRPSQLAELALSKDTADLIGMIKKGAEANGTWKEVQDEFVAGLATQGESIPTILKELRNGSKQQQEFLAEVIPDVDMQNTLEKIGVEWQRFGNADFQSIIQNADTALNNAVGLVDAGNTKQLKALIDAGGEKMKTALRAGVLQDIQKAGIGDFVKGETVVDVKGITKAISKYEDNGLFDMLFTKEVQQELKDTKMLASYLKDQTEAGTSLVMANIASQVRDPVGIVKNPAKFVHALLEINTSKNVVTPGWLGLSNYLVNTPIKKVKKGSVAAGVIAGAAFKALDNLELQEDFGEEESLRQMEETLKQSR